MGEPFRPGAWGNDPADAATLARFILRPSNRYAVEEIAALMIASSAVRNAALGEASEVAWEYDTRAARDILALKGGS